MYLWVGIDVDEQLHKVKSLAQKAEKQIGFEHSNFTLPLHISLKISFQISDIDYDQIVQDIAEIYHNTKPFSISVKGLEVYDNIAWIRMNGCEALNMLHDRLNTMLLEKYHIPLHEYDLDYKFHTTLFMDDNVQKVDWAYQQVKDTELPTTLHANCFLIGSSPTGQLGTFSVRERICV